jgi:hypothetical protein
MTLCETFYGRSIRTWVELLHAYRAAITLNEESITDYHLLEIQLAHPFEVRTHKFSKWRESRASGADWEWWIGGMYHQWIGLRIQAKKIDFATGTYPGLPRKSWHKRQVDRLIESSAHDGVSPHYCFYTSRDEPPDTFECRCGAVLTSSYARGCSIHPAAHVRALIDAGHDRVDQIIPGSVPWSCLFCCPRWGAGQEPLADRVRAFFTDGYPDYESFLPRTLEVPPDYVQQLLGPAAGFDVPAAFSPPAHVSHVLVTTDLVLFPS